MNFDGFGHSNLKTDQRTLFSLQNFLHLQKSRGTEVFFFLDVNILGNYKYLFRELGVAWKWSNKCSSCVLQKWLPKSSCIVQYFWDHYPQNVWLFIWQSLPGENNGNIINGLQHFIIYIVGLLQHRKAVNDHITCCLMWHWEKVRWFPH